MRMVSQSPSQAIHAQLTKSFIVKSDVAFNSMKRVIPSYYFGRPLACFKFEGLSSNDQQKIQQMGINPMAGSPGVFLGSPDAEDLPVVYGLAPTQGRFNPGAVNPDGYLAYIYGLRGMEAFTGVMNAYGNKAARMGMHGAGMKVTDIDESGRGSLVVNWEVVESTQVNPQMAAEMSKQTLVSDYMGPVFVHYNDSMKILGSYLDISDARNLVPGVAFGYFPGMLLPDKDYTSHVFGSMFKNTLGNTHESCHATWSRIRAGFRNIAALDCGRILSHVYLGIELAREACVPMVVLHVGGVYQGFVLFGSLRIHHISTEHKSVSADKLQVEIRDLNKHEKALSKIMVEINAAFPGTIQSLNDISSSRKLANLFYSIDFNDLSISPAQDTICDLLEALTFDMKYAPISISAVQDFLRFVVTGDTSHLSRHDHMITRRLVSSKDRVEFGLAIFGPEAPTMNYEQKGKGSTYSIPQESSLDPLTAVPVGGSRILKFIPFSVVSFGLAVNQWQALINTKSFTIPSARKNRKEFTDARSVTLKVGSSPAFESIWSLVKQVAFYRGEARALKRKVPLAEGEEEMPEAGPSKKAKGYLANDF